VPKPSPDGGGRRRQPVGRLPVIGQVRLVGERLGKEPGGRHVLFLHDTDMGEGHPVGQVELRLTPQDRLPLLGQPRQVS
jgi:hypothetical protein